jgi:hypothetical protein
VSSLITRRKFIVGAAAASLLAGCQAHPIKGFLGAMKDWNENFEGFVFSPGRLAPEVPASETTAESAFPAYFISDSIPSVPANWTLSVGGGLVAWRARQRNCEARGTEAGRQIRRVQLLR